MADTGKAADGDGNELMEKTVLLETKKRVNADEGNSIDNLDDDDGPQSQRIFRPDTIALSCRKSHKKNDNISMDFVEIKIETK